MSYPRISGFQPANGFPHAVLPIRKMLVVKIVSRNNLIIPDVASIKINGVKLIVLRVRSYNPKNCVADFAPQKDWSFENYLSWRDHI